MILRFGFVLFFYLNCFGNSSDFSHFISFIIPCYNCQDTVEESIASIYEQTLAFPFEVICTDDGSTDETASVLLKCSRNYPNFFVFSHVQNKGGGAARNTCVRHSRGDLIFCLDSDNILAPCSVMPLIQLIDQNQCDVAAFEVLRCFERKMGGKWGSIQLSVPGYTYDIYNWLEFPTKNPGFSGNYLYTRKSYNRAGGYPEDLVLDTHAFGYRQLAAGSVMKILPHSFYWHRIGIDSYYIREARKQTITPHHAQALQFVSEVFSEQTRLDFLEHKDPTYIVEAFLAEHMPRSFRLASPQILQSLFNAYRFREEKNYKEAADEFAKAICFGCQSQKIKQFHREMLLRTADQD